MDGTTHTQSSRSGRRSGRPSRPSTSTNPTPGDDARARTSTCSRCCRTRPGSLHMGHVLNYTLGDVVTHFQRRHGFTRAAADGLRLVRPARRERRDQGRRPPARDHRAQHGGDPRPDAPHGLGDRLAARGLRARADVLPLDAVAVPEVPRARARLPQGGAGQLVPERPDGARERARRRRPLLALRRRSSRRGTWRSGSSRSPPTPTQLLDDLATIDWPERTKKIQTQLDRPLRRARRCCSASTSSTSTSRSSRRVPTRCSARRSSSSRPSRRSSTSSSRDDTPRRCGRTRAIAAARPTEEREQREKTGVFTGPLRDEPGQRRADPDLGRRLRADGVRHRRDHGRARARRARPEFARDVRPADRPGDRRRREADQLRRSSTGRTREEAKPRDRRVAVASTGRAKPAINYRLRDWSFSRQRYWGARSRSSTATTTASCRCPRTSCRCCCRRSTTTARRASRRSPPTPSS